MLKEILIAIALFALLMFLMKAFAYRSVANLKGKRFEFLNDGVVFIYSPSCFACKIMKPRVEELIGSANILMLDISKEESQEVIKELNIRALPTTLLVRSGIIEDAKVGVFDIKNLIRGVKDGNIS